MAKHSQPQEGEQEIALPGDILAETILKFIEATIRLPIRAPMESREELITSRQQAAISIEHVGFMKTAKPHLPTMEEIAQKFRNTRINPEEEEEEEEEVSESSVNPLFTEWLQRVLDETVKRIHQQERSETAMEKEIERAMEEEQKGTNVKLLSLGVGPLISQEKKDKI